MIENCSLLPSKGCSGIISAVSGLTAIIAAITTIALLSCILDNWIKGATQANPILLKESVIQMCWNVAKWTGGITIAGTLASVFFGVASCKREY